MTKLAVLCDRLVEVGWLTMAVTTPLYFGVFSNRVFEPDKIVILRCLALVMAAAFIVGWLERLGENGEADSGEGVASWPSRVWASLCGDPLLAATVVLVVVNVLATITSIFPHASIWGSYVRLQGLYSLAAFVLVFLMIRQRMRSKVQLDRLLTVIIVTTIPIATYGILQHFGWDPLPWSGDTTFRVTSTMGNAIFLAAYLGMVIPLTAAKLVGACEQLRHPRSLGETPIGNGNLWVSVKYGGLVALAVVFILMFIITAGLNPVLWWGLMPAIAVFVALVMILPIVLPTRASLMAEAMGLSVVLLLQLVAILFTQSRGPWIGLGAGLTVLVVIVSVILDSRRLAVGATAVAAALVLILIVFNLPSSPLEPLRGLPYVGRLGSLTESATGTGRVRVLIWQGVGELMTTLPDVGLQDDPLRVLRPILGYGPESMYVAYNKVYQPELGHLEARGASPDRSHNDLMDYLVTTGIAGVLSYLAVIAAMLTVGWRALRRANDVYLKLILAGVIAALISHFVESQFGIVIASTRLLFWVYAGMIASLALTTQGVARQVTLSEQTVEEDASLRPTTALAFATVGMVGGRGLGGVVRPNAVRKGREERRGHKPKVGHGRSEAGRNTATSEGADASILTGLWLLAGYLAMTMIGFAILARTSLAIDPQWALPVELLWTLIGVAVIARSLEWRQAVAFCRVRWIPLYIPLLLALSAGCLMNTNAIAADIQYKRGLTEDNYARASMVAGRSDQAIQQRIAAIAGYREAIRLVPNEDYYYLFLGRAYVEMASSRTDDTPRMLTEPTLEQALTIPVEDVADLSRLDLLWMSRVVLEEAYRLNPLNTDHSANLARLYRTWGDLVDPGKLDVAADYYHQACRLSPRSAQLLCEWAQVDLARGDVEGAVERLKAAEQLDQRFVATFVLLGDAYQMAGRFDDALEAHSRAVRLDVSSLSDKMIDRRVQAYIEHGQGEEMAEVYRQAVANQPDNGPGHGAYGYVLYQMGKVSEAVAEFEVHAKLSPGDYMAHQNLALTYNELGRTSEALVAAERALELAPSAQRTWLRDLVDSLRMDGNQ